MPALPSGLTEPLWDQFTALLPDRPVYVPTHPPGCYRRGVSDQIVFDKLLRVLRFRCSYPGIADSTCPARTIRARRDEWIKAGVFAALEWIALAACDRIVGLGAGGDRRGWPHHRDPWGSVVAGPSRPTGASKA